MYINAIFFLHLVHMREQVQFRINILAYTVLLGLAPQYLIPLGPFAYLPGRRSFRSASSSRLVNGDAAHQTAICHQPGFPACCPTSLKQFTG